MAGHRRRISGSGKGAMQLRGACSWGRDLATRPLCQAVCGSCSRATARGARKERVLRLARQAGEAGPVRQVGEGSVLRGLVETGGRPFISRSATGGSARIRRDRSPSLAMSILAWSYSYQDLDSGQAMSRPGKFMQVVSDLLHGYRVGIGFASLMRALAEPMPSSPPCTTTPVARPRHSRSRVTLVARTCGCCVRICRPSCCWAICHCVCPSKPQRRLCRRIARPRRRSRHRHDDSRRSAGYSSPSSGGIFGRQRDNRSRSPRRSGALWAGHCRGPPQSR